MGQELPLPARVEAFHTHCGSALRPVVLHSEGTAQGVAGAGVPPGQKWPTGHTTGVALVEPARHPKPGAALQVPLQVALVRFTEAPKEPAGQG